MRLSLACSIWLYALFSVGISPQLDPILRKAPPLSKIGHRADMPYMRISHHKSWSERRIVIRGSFPQHFTMMRWQAKGIDSVGIIKLPPKYHTYKDNPCFQPFYVAEAAVPFCCLSFSSNFSNSCKAISSS